MINTQSAAELRRSWFRGVREEDVDEALDELEQRNRELAAELAASNDQVRELADRVISAEGTLQDFHAGFEHVGTLLTLAEERARETEREAELHSIRVAGEAEERVRAAEAEVAALVAKKRAALDALDTLGSRLTTLTAAPAAEAAPEPMPEPKRITVADLLALEAEGQL